MFFFIVFIVVSNIIVQLLQFVDYVQIFIGHFFFIEKKLTYKYITICFFSSLQMITGGIFVRGILDMATNVSSPVHFYVYDHSNMVSMNKIYGPCLQSLGVSHGDEIMSLFTAEGLVVLFGEDLKVSKVMVDLWTNFASTEYVMLVLNKCNTGADLMLL